MKYNIIIEKPDEEELNEANSINKEKDNLYKDNPFYKEAEKKIMEFIGQKRQMLQEDLIKEIYFKMRNIDEECQLEKDKLLHWIITEMKKKELLSELNLKLKEKEEK